MVSVLRRSPLVAACAAFLLVVVVCAIAGNLFAPMDPAAQNPMLGVSGPGNGHLLGTDQLGRDVFSQLIAGARAAVFGPLMVALGCGVIGGLTGLAAAYFGGWRDLLANRFADLVFALPALLVAAVVVGIAGGGYWVTAGLLLVLSIPSEIRLCRSAAMVQVRMPYVDAARTLGLPASRAIFRHVLPNIVPTLVATVLLDFVGALIGFASMSFLGLGVPPGSPDWGSLLAAGQPLIAENPWLATAPAILLILTASSATLLGDWVHERLSNHGGRA
ncbi:ABC transporter permease [Amycolatopsis jejuensis]|uniref:ABC transporter permease n=1 Tax=Amycolatopsis jejuensis TaxID=330084 RepID=UPI0005255B5B|nr:ABC transporter permease [Amycolatopsis jejuensis]